jgi:hypothetical protein
MTELLIVMELDVALERLNISPSVLNKQLLLLLDECRHTCLSENIEENVVLVGDDGRHQNVNELVCSINQVCGVSKHLA